MCPCVSDRTRPCVSQKYSGKKQENHTMREELLVLQVRLLTQVVPAA